ncbi:MAG: dihydrolipoamide acetyltransferase family protein [Pseudomonadota bacterium]
MGVFAMPSLGADMQDAILVEWLVAPGEAVRRGDVVAAVETQKGAIEIEVFEDGVVESLAAQVGERIPVGAPLAIIRGASDTEPAPPPAMPLAPAKTLREDRPAPKSFVQAPPARWPAGTNRAGASPAARALAAERGLDLGILDGTGPGGAIRLADVEAALTRGAGTSRPTKPGLDPDAMRAAIAAAMARSKREIPHYYMTQTIDLEPVATWLAAMNAERAPDARILMGAFLTRAAALAARDVPEMNGHFVDGAFRPASSVHAGVVVSLRGGGLIAPAIHDADHLDLDDVMAAMRDVVARTRTGRLRGSEMSDATITVSSLGDVGSDSLLGVIYPPQVALVGFGSPVQRPWIVDGAVQPRTVITVSLAADHRVSDGRRGARFLSAIARYTSTPEAL